ncbi:MAG: TetR family transcriptional regulator [Dehalococcoidia bacterium]
MIILSARKKNIRAATARRPKSNDFRDRIASSEQADAARDLRVTRSDTRARLLAAALERFAKVGFSNTTMRDLGADVGIKAPAIYSHFKSKEEILGLALIWAMDDFNAAVLSSGEDDLDPVERLRRILSRHIAYQLDNPIVARAFDVLASSKILERLGQTGYQTEVDTRLRVYVSTVRHLIKEISARQSGKVAARLAGHAITTMYDQVGRWYHSGSKKEDMDVTETYWGFVCAILRINGKT